MATEADRCLKSEQGETSRKKKVSVSIQEPPVSDLRGYTVIKEEEKHGPLYNAIPTMPLPLAGLCCFLNLILPGVGEYLPPSSISVSPPACE